MRSQPRYHLNGCDTFMLGMDYAMRKDGCAGNICHALLSFPSGTEMEPIVRQLTSSDTLRFLNSLRLVRPFLRTPHWIPAPLDQPLSIPELPFVDSTELDTFILSHSFDPACAAPCGFFALQDLRLGPSLLFYWHHSLCDARGAEELLHRLATGAAGIQALFVRPTNEKRLRTALSEAQAVRPLIFEKLGGAITRLPNPDVVGNGRRIHRIRFSEDETRAIDSLSQDISGGIFPMALHLAASARALFQTLHELGLPVLPLSIPVPHDMRRYARERSLLSNQVSFLFFRIDPTSCVDLRTTANAIIDQLHAGIAEQQPQKMLGFLHLLRALPSSLLWRIIETPAKGHPASMYFSDIGSSFTNLFTVAGAPIESATHYPPVLTPPGFTTVWSRFRGSLSVAVCYDSRSLGSQGIDLFVAHLRNELQLDPSWNVKQSAAM